MENREMNDFRTPLQRERDARNEKIYADYLAIINQKETIENISKWAIWRTIGEKYGMGAEGIRAVIAKMTKKNTTI